jgi:excisionase family DNA binding protein
MAIDAETEGNPLNWRFMTPGEIAEMLRISRMTVYRLIHAGELPAMRIGRDFRVPEHVVTQFLRSSEVV